MMVSKRSLISRKIIFGALLITILYVILFLVHNNDPVDDVDRNNRLEKIQRLIKSLSSNTACKHPYLPVNSSEMLKFIKYVPPIDCSSTADDWVVCKESECLITDEAKMRYGKIKCSFTDLLRVDDFTSKAGDTTHSDSYYKLEASDVVKVACEAETDSWKSILTGIRLDSKLYGRVAWSELPADSLKLNVLMFGFDSLSKNTFVRKLPKSYAYLTETLNGHVLDGYNIVGDGTPQALIPILTGKTELELPEVRKRIPNAGFVDQYPMVWKEFSKYGYATAFFEDCPVVGTFTYRLNGFKEQPTDHYMRPYYVEAVKHWHAFPPFCMGSVPRHRVMMNQIKNFFSVYKYKPKFLFGFHGELSHDDYNLISAADDDLLQFLTHLSTSGALNNTLLVLMADHGHRFATIRNTIQGKQEERLPFFSFTFPPWFKTKHPEAYNNFLSNVNRLTTPFDIYPTLLSVLHLGNTGPANLSQRSLSLFSKIPAERSCAHAYIEPHWCACLDWYSVPLSSSITARLATTLTTFLNNYTYAHRNLCAQLEVSKVMWVLKMVPNDNLLKFNKAADLDGFVADLNAKTVVDKNLYQIKALVVPGESLFEASIAHYVEDDHLELKLSDISRINKYGKQARCIENDFPNLRKYCYCLN